jgi:hypothetical protein
MTPLERKTMIRPIPAHFAKQFHLDYDFSFRVYKVYERMSGGWLQLIAGYQTWEEAVECMEKNC